MVNKYTKTKPDMTQMTKLYNDGMTQKEVAEEMGLTQKIVWRCLRDAGVICRSDAPRNQKAELNNNWKGNEVTYAAFHYRLTASKGKPKFCEVCKTSDPLRSYDWANLTGKYDDPSDYKRMCRSCHWKYDKKYLNWKGATGGRPSPMRGGDALCPNS
jgi:predicted transcriptional regulator